MVEIYTNGRCQGNPGLDGVIRDEIGPVRVHPVVARITLDNVVAFDGIAQGALGPGEAPSGAGPASMGAYAIRPRPMAHLSPRRTV
jgi:hypothetical protein